MGARRNLLARIMEMRTILRLPKFPLPGAVRKCGIVRSLMGMTPGRERKRDGDGDGERLFLLLYCIGCIVQVPAKVEPR